MGIRTADGATDPQIHNVYRCRCDLPPEKEIPSRGISYVAAGEQICLPFDRVLKNTGSGFVGLMQVMCLASVVHMVCGPDTPILPDRTISYKQVCRPALA